MIVPIRESLALLPQMIVGCVIRRFAKPKYFWAYAALIQGLAGRTCRWVGDHCVGNGVQPSAGRRLHRLEEYGR